jgi:hypothetical protein
MSVTDRPSTTLLEPTASPGTRRVPPVLWWAIAGAVVLAFEAFVLVRWVSGPNFKQVPAGSTPTPGWMQPVLDVWQIAGLLGALFCFYWFLVRPWHREHRMTLDGLLVIAFATLWFQDPLSAYFGHWFTYNTHLINFGSWVSDVPGWQSYGKPGAMIAEPIVLIAPVYVYFIMVATLLGCAAMRAVKRRRPDIAAWKLVAICFVAMSLLDIVGEGLVWLPLGFWEYPGGIPFLFSGTYHQFPLNEMLTIATTFTGIASLRFFTNDRGQTFADRGIDRLKVGRRRHGLVRGLAVIGAVHLVLFVGYNLPNAWVGSHELGWPKDLQNRSYLTDRLCGPGTDNLCPGDGHGFVLGGNK